MHLVPTILLGIALFISWRYELYGTAIFFIFGILGLIFFNPEPSNWVLPGIMFVVASLFLLNWYIVKDIEVLDTHSEN